MDWRTGRTGALCATALITATAGCGGSSQLSKAQYEKKIQAEGAQLQSLSSSLNLASTGDPKTLASKIDRLQRQTEKTANDVGNLKPPANAADDNTKIAATLHRFAALFGQLKAAAAANDKARYQALGAQVQTVAQQAKQATADLKSKGYSVGVLGR